MGSGDDGHDGLTFRGRLTAWELEPEGERVSELPERERELAPIEEERVAMPAWANVVDAEVVALAEEDLDRVWRHLGAAHLGQVLFEAAALARDELRAAHLESCPEDPDERAAIDDERSMPPIDELVVLACGRWYGVRLPH